MQLLDGARIAPGATFSFNDRVGERTLERGFRPAPVIVGDKYEEDVGGGVSQVATTVFNAAWEAGLPISERNPHALYIARYQLGRDATVNYPNLDLKFVNDTGHWIVLGAGAGGERHLRQPLRQRHRPPRREHPGRAPRHGRAEDGDRERPDARSSASGRCSSTASPRAP